jgi:hypothetical protein
MWKTWLHSPQTASTTISVLFFFDFIPRKLETTKLTQRTVVPGHLTRWTTPLVWDATDPTDVAFVVLVVSGVACVPAPLGDGAPMFDVHFHRVGGIKNVFVFFLFLRFGVRGATTVLARKLTRD